MNQLLLFILFYNVKYAIKYTIYAYKKQFTVDKR